MCACVGVGFPKKGGFLTDVPRTPQNRQEKASADIRGEFYRTTSRVIFAVDFLVDFLGPFPWTKIEASKPTQNLEIPKKHRVYANFFEKFERTFAFFPVK